MKSILFILMLIGGSLSFNSYAANCSAGVKLPSGSYMPLITGSIGSDVSFFINVNGCQYIPVDINYIAYTSGPLAGGVFSTNGYISTGVDVLPSVSESFSYNDDGTLLDNSHGSTSAGVGTGLPDGADSGTGTSGGASDGSLDGSSSGSSTPQPSEPEKPYPADAGAFQLLDSFYSCS
ncbi:hypothetical protein AA464_28580, partial [Salmonella enterica subsp. enterica serovar Newport]|nr:hypothetical protein [Salmonella enterica subsp. enterica serovar Newport]